MESADIVLMKNSVLDVVTTIGLSRATIRNIRQNLFWPFGYNVMSLPFGGLLLNPMITTAAMNSVSVVLNARRFGTDRLDMEDR